MLGALPYTTVILIERVFIGFIIVSAVIYLATFSLVKVRPTLVGAFVIVGWTIGAVGFVGVVVVQPDTLNIVLAVLFLAVTANHARKLRLRACKTIEQSRGINEC
jgi:hypothetical protein